MHFNLKKIKTKPPIPLIEYTDCYAKTYIDNGNMKFGYDVFTHSSIVASVAKELLNKNTPLLSSIVPKYAELPALLHDIGKICPTFQKKIQPSLDRLISVDPNKETLWGGHSNLSALAVQDIYPYNSDALSYIVGKHHERLCTHPYTIHSEVFGQEPWQQERRKCIYALIKDFYGLDTPPELTLDEDIIHYLLGLTIVADWIGSGEAFTIPDKAYKTRIPEAVKNIGFGNPPIKHHLSFEDIFSFSPRKIQKEFYDSVKGPGLYILEAPMGLGKTEAALYAAYKILEQNKASGIYFALPTQLTSEKIHERMGSFLEKIIQPSADKARITNMLLHGKAWLKSYGITPFTENERELDYSWFAHKKRALLASFGVGTIDQALMSVINVKHASVRAFGLAGKVVILDEVHSYDMYTGTLLNELINTLLTLQCTVIVLSATLTEQRRVSLFPNATFIQPKSNAYPLVSSFSKEYNNFMEIGIDIPPQETKTVAIHKLSSDEEAIEKALEAADQGSQVLWIENTVADAQERYKEALALGQGSNIEIGLLHSRFTQDDRNKIEDHWINLYGKASHSRYQRGRILFGTQVLEQSIDIDADLLFSRFCPMDMFIQRLGRLHRHNINIRPPHVQCEAYLLMPTPTDLQASGINAFGKSQFVYSPYVLLRSYEVLQNISNLCLPHSIRPLLEATYKDRDEQGLLASTKWILEEEKKKLQMQALRSLTTSSAPMSDEQASTRMCDIKQKEVLLLRNYTQNKNMIEVQTLSEERYRIYPHMSYAESKEISVELMRSTVKITDYHYPEQKNSSFNTLSNLAGGINDCALVGDDNAFKSSNDKYQLFYTSKLGLVVTEK